MDQFGVKESPQDILLGPIQQLLRCARRCHRSKMMCTMEMQHLKKLQFYRKIRYFGWGHHEELCSSTVMRTPCGQIRVEAYATFAWCKWFILTAPSLTINSTFIHFNIPRASLNCKQDRVEIFEIGEPDHKGKFCGKHKPFTVVPNFSKVQIDFHIVWRASPQRSSFSMLYQVTKKNKYIIPGKADHENMETNTSVEYHFSMSNRIMTHGTKNVYALHFNVYIDYNVHISVLANAWPERTTLRVYDGPSAICHLLKEFNGPEKNITAASYGTSLLLLMHSHSKDISNISIIFSQIPHLAEVSTTLVATNTKKSLDIAQRQSEYCTEKHQIIYCNFWIESRKQDHFVKLESLDIFMNIPGSLDCSFGGVWIFDSKSPEHVWKWCSFKTSMRQITSASSKFNIKVMLYQANGDTGYITMQYSLSTCVGIFTHDMNLASGLSHIVNIDHEESYGITRMYMTKVSGRCFVIQAVHESTKKFTTILAKGSRYSEINEFTILKTGFQDIIDCETWEISFEGMYSLGAFGTGKFSYLRITELDPFWSNVSLRAVNVHLLYNGIFSCGYHEGVIIAVQDGCHNLLTDTTILKKSHQETGDYSRSVRLLSACMHFTITVEMYHTFRLAFDDRLLCFPIAGEEPFPCRSKQGVLCENRTSCTLHIEAQLLTSSAGIACHPGGYYVDVIGFGFKQRVRLRWHIHSTSHMMFTADLHGGDEFDILKVNNFNMDVTNYDKSGHSDSCELEITQKILRREYSVVHQTMIKQELSSTCLRSRSYRSGVLEQKWTKHCFKWDLSPEHVIVGDETYIRINSSDLTWLQAEQFCQSHNAHLVSITSPEEEQIVKAIFHGGLTLQPSALYTGLHYRNHVPVGHLTMSTMYTWFGSRKMLLRVAALCWYPWVGTKRRFLNHDLLLGSILITSLV